MPSPHKGAEQPDKGCPTWTPQDETHALAQGWGLFFNDSRDVIIQKMDEPGGHPLWVEGMPEEEVFSSDGAAVRFVRRKAREGDETAAKAIETHDRNIRHYRNWKRYQPF